MRRALEGFADLAGVQPGWRATIEKRIPVASGLGGGSSDAAAASELPPPRPAATGILFSIVARQPGWTPARSAKPSRARRTSVSSGKPWTRSSGAGSSARVSASVIRWSTVATSCFPSGRFGPTTRARLSLAGARSSLKAPWRAERTPAGRAPRPWWSAAVRAGPAPPLRDRARPGRRARGSWATACAGARTPPRQPA